METGLDKRGDDGFEPGPYRNDILSLFEPAIRPRLEAALKEFPGFTVRICVSCIDKLNYHHQLTYEDPALAEMLISIGEQMRGCDPLEKMLISQILWTHLRLGYLVQTARIVREEDKTNYHELADKAAGTFRRQMSALSEYRSPRNHVTVNQANFAQQQIVQSTVGLSGPAAGDADGPARRIADQCPLPGHHESADTLPVVSHGGERKSQ